ncbi:hypothetical protein IB69_017790 [Xanthomonas citri]|nr:hypothetical protein IB69_017790 [Xanthomonas citri]
MCVRDIEQICAYLVFDLRKMLAGYTSIAIGRANVLSAIFQDKLSCDRRLIRYQRPVHRYESSTWFEPFVSCLNQLGRNFIIQMM